MGGIGGDGSNRDRSRIEIGMPDDPGRRCGAVRMLGESAAPTGADRGAERAGCRASRCWRARARRHSRHPGAAIPTSVRPDRCRAAAHNRMRCASQGGRTPQPGRSPAAHPTLDRAARHGFDYRPPVRCCFTGRTPRCGGTTISSCGLSMITKVLWSRRTTA